MRFQTPTLGTAVFMTGISMGALGLGVLLPIAIIQWTWNAITQACGVGLPVIAPWQAALLYIAAALSLFLSGFVSIEVEMD